MSKTVKVRLDVITVTEGEVEIPSKCPQCGADFHEQDSLVGTGWMAVEQTAHLDDADELDWDQGTNDFPEAQHVDGYKCGRCGEPVAGEAVK